MGVPPPGPLQRTPVGTGAQTGREVVFGNSVVGPCPRPGRDVAWPPVPGRGGAGQCGRWKMLHQHFLKLRANFFTKFLQKFHLWAFSREECVQIAGHL